MYVISLHEFLIHVIGNSIECIPISVLKTSVVIGSDLEIGSYSLCSAFCYFISMCLILIFVHLQVVAGMSARLDVFVVDIYVA